MTQHEAGSNDRYDKLAAHSRECDACRAEPPAVDRIAAILEASAVEIDMSSLTARLLQRVRPELARLARAAFWREVLVAILLALVPLPVIVAYNTLLLSVLYNLLSSIVPAFIATYLVGTEAALLLLLWGVTYAAIPVIVARNLPHPAAAA